MKYCHSSCIVPPTNLPKMFAFEPAVRDDTKLLVQFQLNRIALIFTPEKSLRGEWGGWAKNANNIWQSYTLSPQDRRQLEAKKRIAVPPFQYFWPFKRKNTFLFFLSNQKGWNQKENPVSIKIFDCSGNAHLLSLLLLLFSGSQNRSSIGTKKVEIRKRSR